MKITKTVQGGRATLQLAGEFDTLHVSSFSEQVEELLAANVSHVILDLRLVEFMNSTALGAIVKAHKQVKTKGGELVIARPSVFCKEILARVGLDRLIKSYPTAEGAMAHFDSLYGAGAAGKTARAKEPSPVEMRDESNLLVAFVDPEKAAAAGGHLVARMTAIGSETIELLWNGEKLGFQGEKLARLFAPGTQLRVKFKIALFKKDYFENVAAVASVAVDKDGGARVQARFGKMNAEEAKALRQFTQDVEFLREELRSATKKN